jgi:hypothetical protein
MNARAKDCNPACAWTVGNVFSFPRRLKEAPEFHWRRGASAHGLLVRLLVPLRFQNAAESVFAGIEKDRVVAYADHN